MRSARLMGALVVGILVAACGEPVAQPTDGANAVVEHVIDGDTIDVQIDGGTERVRLLGIDAPESVDRARPVQCYGAEASAELTRLLPAGSSVLLVRDLEARDRFGRLLAYVYRVHDDLFVNHALVAAGYADVLIIDPNDAHASLLRTARTQARANDAGLWGVCGGADVPLAS